MHWTEKSEKPPSLLTKTENRRLNWRKLANRSRHQNQKIAVLSAKTKKTNQKLAKFAKPKTPTTPSLLYYDILVRNVLFTVFWKIMWVVYHLHRKIDSLMICGKFGFAKMLDGKFCSDWLFTIYSKNSNLTKFQPAHNSKVVPGEEVSQQRSFTVLILVVEIFLPQHFSVY